MKTYLLKIFDIEEGSKNIRVEADGYIVGSDGSIHLIKEQHLGRPPVPFLAFASGHWSMITEVPQEIIDKGVDKDGIIDVVANEEAN